MRIKIFYISILMLLGILGTGCQLWKQNYPTFSPVEAPVRVQATQDPLLWAYTFYQHKQFEQIIPWINTMEASGLLNYGPALDYTMGFLVALFQKYPEEIKNFENHVSRLTERAESVYVYALIYAANAETKRQLRVITDRNPYFKTYLGRAVPNVKINRVRSLNQLNILFGMFHATGDENHLHKILDCLSENQYRKSRDKNLIEINDVVIQQLADNCVRDSELFHYCESNEANFPSDISEDMELVLNSARSQIKINEETKAKEAQSPNKVAPATPTLILDSWEGTKEQTKTPDWVPSWNSENANSGSQQ